MAALVDRNIQTGVLRVAQRALMLNEHRQRLLTMEDPLHSGNFFLQLPTRRRAGAVGMEKVRQDTTEMARVVREEMDIPNLTLHEARIVHQGLAMAIAASLPTGQIRHPRVNDTIPGGEEALKAIAKKSKLPKRNEDTGYTYGDTGRTFTDYPIPVQDESGKTHMIPAELVFIASIAEGQSQKDTFTKLALEISGKEITDQDFAGLVNEATDAIATMTTAAIAIHAMNFPFAWFKEELQPILEPEEVDGKILTHTGAHNFLALAATELAGASPKRNRTYSDYVRRNLEYATIEDREAFAELKNRVNKKGSLVDQVISNMPEDLAQATPQQIEVAVAVIRFTSELLKFRGAHRGLVEKVTNGRRGYKGSGGDIKMIDPLVAWTTQQQQKLKPLHERLLHLHR